MREYIDILEVSPLGDGRNWILRDGFFYDYKHVGSGKIYHIEVPPMFMTDYASTPRPLWWFIRPWGKHGMATVIHDWLYWEQKIPEWDDLKRKDVEKIFLQCLSDSRVGFVKKWLIYWAVKYFGRWAWNGNIKRREEGWHRVALKWPTSAFDTPKDLQ